MPRKIVCKDWSIAAGGCGHFEYNLNLFTPYEIEIESDNYKNKRVTTSLGGNPTGEEVIKLYVDFAADKELTLGRAEGDVFRYLGVFVQAWIVIIGLFIASLGLSILGKFGQ